VRYQLASATAPFGVAPVAGFRVGRLSWHYQNPILAESDGVLREVGSDNLWHYTPYLGLAVSLVRFKHVEAGVTGLAGFRHYATESRQGFTNDLFPDDHYRELRFEARFF
jgi:hypothetical protein